MPEKHGRVGDSIDINRDDPEAFAEALRFTGDRLVLKKMGDGETRVDEYRARATLVPRERHVYNG